MPKFRYATYYVANGTRRCHSVRQMMFRKFLPGVAAWTSGRRKCYNDNPGQYLWWIWHLRCFLYWAELPATAPIFSCNPTVEVRLCTPFAIPFVVLCWKRNGVADKRSHFALSEESWRLVLFGDYLVSDLRGARNQPLQKIFWGIARIFLNDASNPLSQSPPADNAGP